MLEYVGIIYNNQNKTTGTRIARGRGSITQYMNSVGHTLQDYNM